MTPCRYFLSSLESKMLKEVRVCDFVAFGRFDTGKNYALATLDPPILMQQVGFNRDVSEVVLAARHEGHDLVSISEFPCFVHVSRPLVDDIRNRSRITASDLENLAWGELYRSRSDAENHVFDCRR